MSENKGKGLTIIVSILMTATIGVSLLFWRDMSTLNKAYVDVNNIECISSGTQRLTSLAQSNQQTQKDIFFIDDSTKASLELGKQNTLSVFSDTEMVALGQEVLKQWYKIEELLQVEGLHNDSYRLIELGIARDAHYQAMTDLTNRISDYTTDLNTRISQYQLIVITLFFAIAMTMLNNILRTHTALKHSNELARTAQIDMATGLYNRSKCQELFKNNNANATKKRPAILVMDLNDLKKTNDTLGHRVGDELIHSFASVLKKATSVHVTPPFIGRYGGDEFIVYYEDISGEEEIKIYLKELTFFTQEFNNNESRFQISYAVGYAYQSENSQSNLTIRQLFDRADEAMYEDKIAGKKAKNPNYAQEGDGR